MKTISLKYEGSLANRVTAASERKRIEDAVSKGEHVVIDYSNVVSLSGSYADELFGSLVKHHGAEFIKTSIKVIGASKDTARSIGVAIQNRMTAAAA